MSTTTIRLSEELKSRVAAAAERAGTTEHDFILQSIVEKIDQETELDDFYDEADRRYAELLESGETISGDDMVEYLEKRLAGETPDIPAAKKFNR